MNNKTFADRRGLQLLIIFGVWLVTRVAFYRFLFRADLFNIHMSQAMDKRALGILQAEPVANVTAWGAYPVFLSGPYKLLAHLGLLADRITIISWANQILMLFAALILWDLLPRSRWALAAPLIFLIDFQWLYFGANTTSEAPFVFLSAVALWYLYSKKILSAPVTFGLGFAAAMMILLRGQASGWVAVVLAAIAWRLWRERGQVLIVVLILGFLLPYSLTGYAVKQMDMHGQSSINLNRAVNLAQTWCRSRVIGFQAYQGPAWFRPPAYRNLTYDSSVITTTPFGNQMAYVKMAAQCLWNEPARLAVQMESGLLTLWGAVYPDPLKWESRAWIWLPSRLLHIFLLAGVLLAWRPLWRDHAPSVLALAALTVAIYGASPGEERFKLSLAVPLVLLGVTAWRIHWHNRALLRPAATGVALALLASMWQPSWAREESKRRAEFMAMDESKVDRLLKDRLELVRQYRQKASTAFPASPVPTSTMLTWSTENFRRESAAATRADRLSLYRLLSHQVLRCDPGMECPLIGSAMVHETINGNQKATAVLEQTLETLTQSN